MESRSTQWRNLAENPQPLIFAACLVVLALLIGNELWSSTHALLYRPAVAANSVPQGNAAQSFAKQIGDAHLFGRAAGAGSLPETSLQLTLRAVFTATDPQAASAVIEAADGKAQVIRVGNSVSGGAVLKEVHANRVVIERDGALETLVFPAPQSSAEFAMAQKTPGDGDETAPASGEAPPAGASPDEIKRAAILQRLEELRARSSR